MAEHSPPFAIALGPENRSKEIGCNFLFSVTMDHDQRCGAWGLSTQARSRGSPHRPPSNPRSVPSYMGQQGVQAIDVFARTAKFVLTLDGDRQSREDTSPSRGSPGFDTNSVSIVDSQAGSLLHQNLLGCRSDQATPLNLPAPVDRTVQFHLRAAAGMDGAVPVGQSRAPPPEPSPPRASGRS
jgi:hypothetical protein